jgi:tRNA(fMet)-specific endonuclease VapC
MICLIDSSVLIDTLNGRRGRSSFLTDLVNQDVVLACCSVSVTEIYMGMRPGEEVKTEKLLRSLEFYQVDWEAAQLAGELFREWRKKGQTLGAADVTIAAVALTQNLTLLTDNHRHFPMPQLRIVPLPEVPT